MRAQLGIEKMFLVGASMGATASLVVGAQVPVAAVVSISAPGQFPPLDAVAAVPELHVPKLFIVSPATSRRRAASTRSYAAAPQPKQDRSTTATPTAPTSSRARTRGSRDAALMDFLAK